MSLVGIFLFYFNILIGKLKNTLWLLLYEKKCLIVNVWLRHNGGKVLPYNIGDDLNLYVLGCLSTKKIVNFNFSYYKKYQGVNFMCIGSIVDTLVNRRSVIWGSGAIEGLIMPNNTRPLKVCAVRGPLTREFLLKNGISCPSVYGDPAILMPFIYPCNNKKKYRLGIIPHYTETTLDKVQNFIKSSDDKVVLIDVKRYNNYRDVINKISECEIIASSSLHGLILSDAYGVPNVWIKLSHKIKGGDFKYLDYFLGCKSSAPSVIDFVDKEISTMMIESEVKNYERPNYNYKELLKSCPFGDPELIDLMINKVELQNR